MTASSPGLEARRRHRGSAPSGAVWLALELLGYNLVLVGLFPVMAVWLGWRGLVRQKPIGNWKHRLGLVPYMKRGSVRRVRCQPRIWVHAVSAGEVAAAGPVVERLREAFPRAGIAVSMQTTAGMAVAKNACKEADALCYLPFEWPACVGLALWRMRPDLMVVVEKELWPNLLGLARLMGAKVLVVNGRVSDRMMRRARWGATLAWGPAFVRWLYRLPHFLCVQSHQDAARLRQLAVPSERMAVTGNTKVDTLAQRHEEAEARLARELGVAGQEVWLVAGSTHAGEEEAVVEAFRRIREAVPSARLLLAPRHLERVPAVCAMVAGRGMSAARRSEGEVEGREVVVLDTMGELRAAYGLAAAGFVGGTLVRIGGHNLLEPVAVGSAVLFGPYTENCADVADLVLKSGVGFRVSRAEHLAEEFLRIVRDGELRKRIALRARVLIKGQRGAAARCVGVARALLEKVVSK